MLAGNAGAQDNAALLLGQAYSYTGPRSATKAKMNQEQWETFLQLNDQNAATFWENIRLITGFPKDDGRVHWSWEEMQERTIPWLISDPPSEVGDIA